MADHTPFPLLWLPDRPRWLAWSLRLGLVALGIYILLFTWVWYFVTMEIVGVLYSVSQIGVEAEARPGWYKATQTQPLLRGICRFSNAVAERTQPLVGDDVLMAHWEKHRNQWEEAVRRFPKGSRNPEDYRSFDDYVKTIGADRITNLPLRKIGFALLVPSRAIGASKAHRACLGRGESTKYYEFHAQAQTIELPGDATTQGVSAVRVARPSGTRIVETTDGTPLETGYSMRRLSDRWFIGRSD